MNKSALLLKQDRKFWAKNDQMLLADLNPNGAQADPFKTEYAKKLRKDVVPVKPNSMPFKSDEFRPHYESPITTTYKWSTIERLFRTPDNERIFAAQPPARDTPNDYAPMYSCFNSNGVFNPAKLKRRSEMTPDGAKPKSETKSPSAYSPNVTRKTLNAPNNEMLLGGVTVTGLGGASTQSVF